MIRTLLAIILCMAQHYLLAQIVVGETTKFGVSQNPQITVATTGNVINHSDFDFDDVNLRLILTGLDIQNIKGNWVADSLVLAGKNVKFLQGNLVVNGKIRFISGVIRLDKDGKFLFTGPAENIIARSNQSYVDGMFYQTGGGARIFPVGAGPVFASLGFQNAGTASTDTIGIQVMNGAVGFDETDLVESAVVEVSQDHFWQIKSFPENALNKIQSPVRLALQGIDLGTGGRVVLQCNNDGSDPKTLNLQQEDDAENFVRSEAKVTAPRLAVGRVTEVPVTVNALITPFGSFNTNDYLRVYNIGNFKYKKVKLLDRYGVLIKEWGDDFDIVVESWDFKKLSPGNYICIAEYGNSPEEMKSVTQMVTVLRSN
jgi:hypothetical protein